ncbi:hypothetical protein MTO96_018865 [Rhipicephalus appendiculatus]
MTQGQRDKLKQQRCEKALQPLCDAPSCGGQAADSRLSVRETLPGDKQEAFRAEDNGDATEGPHSAPQKQAVTRDTKPGPIVCRCARRATAPLEDRLHGTRSPRPRESPRVP